MAKRRIAKERENRITPDAIAAWRAGDRLALHGALGLKPWMVSPLDCEGDCPWPAGTAGEATWQRSAALRAELAKSIRAQALTIGGKAIRIGDTLEI